LREMGHEVVDRTVLRLLKAKGYSLQANKRLLHVSCGYHTTAGPALSFPATR
jgi:hypothetical protein